MARLSLGGFVCLALAAVDAASLYRRSMCILSPRRQVPKQTMHRTRNELAVLAWGWDNGLMVTTYRVSAATWAVITLAFIGLAGWTVGLTYGLGFLVPVGLAWWLPNKRRERGSQNAGRVAWIVAHQLRLAQSAALFALVLVGIVLVEDGLSRWL